MHKSTFFKLLLTWPALALLLLPGLLPARAAQGSQAAVDAYIEAKMDALNIPGLALAIVRAGRIEHLRGYGAANAAGQPVTPQTPFHIASLSKSITATGVMQLVEAGEVRLDAPVQAYLPWFRLADAQAAARITVRHLLHHTSGLSELEGNIRNLEADLSDQALEASVRRLSGSALNAAPGERFEYSNTNYDILGLIIQTVSGMPYEQFIEENIFARLGMRSSFTGREAARLGGLASGHTYFFGLTLPNERSVPYTRSVTPSAGLYASAGDLAQYLLAHLDRGRGPDGAVLLSPDGMQALHTPGVQIDGPVGYAMGWTVFPFPQTAAAPGDPAPTGLSHGGDWTNYRALMVLVPERELGLVMLINKGHFTHVDLYDNIGWNTMLLALGLEPSITPTALEFLPRYGRLLGAALVLLLAAGAALSLRLLRRQGGRAALWAVYLLLDLALAGYLLFGLLPDLNTTLPLTLAFEPDIGLIYLLILVFTLGWGPARSLLAARKLLEKVRTPAAAPLLTPEN